MRSLPPRRKMKMSFLPLIPTLPSARARLRKGGMFINEARLTPTAARPAFDRNERRVMMFGITILQLKLLLLKTRQAHEETDHAADTAVVRGSAQSGER